MHGDGRRKLTLALKEIGVAGANESQHREQHEKKAFHVELYPAIIAALSLRSVAGIRPPSLRNRSERPPWVLPKPGFAR